MAKSKFINDLPKIYAMYTGGFALFVLLMAFAEKQGMSAKTIGLCFVGFTIVIYAAIGVISRTVQVDAYYLAGRQVPTVFNGMATAADWMSGASFVAMAGGIYFGGYTYMAFLVGWTGGYVLVSSLLAPYLRKFGCYTVPDFIGTRYGGNLPRFFAVIVLFLASFVYVTAQINATGTIASRALGIPFELGIWVGLVSILLCAMLGGMRAVTWTQVAQYIVLIIAYLLPIFWMSWKNGFGIFPHFTLGAEVQRLAELEAQYGLIKNAPDAIKAAGVPGGLASISVPHSAVPASGMAAWSYISLAICMMVGTASLPHILMRYFTTPSVTSARRSVGWSLFFIFLLYFSAPMLATLSKIQLLDPNFKTAIIGKKISDVVQIEWVKNWMAVGQVYIADFNKDGILQLNEWFMRADVVVLATPEVAGLPYFVSGLVAAGGLAAAMSTADGLILAIANALSHDVYYKMIDPRASVQTRLLVARGLLIVIGILAALAASYRFTSGGVGSAILSGVAWAFDFAMSGLFWPLVLGVWWKRATKSGAIAGMVGGLVSGTWYLIYVTPAFMGQPIPSWAPGIDSLRFGIVGATVSLVAMVVVSLLTKPEKQAIQDMVDECRIPSGKVIIKHS